MGNFTLASGPYEVNGIQVSRDGVPVRPLTDAQFATLAHNLAQVDSLTLPQLYDPGNPNSRVFVLSLDGTGNNANVDPREHFTNPALMRENVDSVSVGNPAIGAGYAPGIGTVDIPLPVLGTIANTVDQVFGEKLFPGQTLFQLAPAPEAPAQILRW